MGGSALAQDIEESVELPDDRQHALSVGVFLGGFIASDRHEFYDPLTSTQLELDALSLDIGFRVGYLPIKYVGAELEGNFVAAGVDGGESVSLFGFRGQVIGQYPMQLPLKITPFAVAGLGAMGVSSDDMVLGSDTDLVSYLGAGAKYRVRDEWLARADLRVIGAPEAASYEGATAHWEILLGMSYDIGAAGEPAIIPVDQDGDGIFGSDDMCPEEKGEEPDGCPGDPDPDKDGILAEADSCPEKAETVNSFEDTDGCPDEVPDSDADGIDDLKDSCKDKPEDMDSFEDEDGCPDEDNDKDGVQDSADNCPIVLGPIENRGCPDTDRDEDTVVDRLDNCPDVKGTPENHGCEEKQLVVITKDRLEILDKVFFRTGKATIKRRSFPLLDNVAAVIQSHPEIKMVEVAGHTDDRGEEDKNQELSRARAIAVAKYLVSKGVDPFRLNPEGYGESQPAVEGKGRKAREANRRVEFKLINE
jgi:outer membrane protein OmpA-like peptidoglycan-associated protein